MLQYLFGVIAGHCDVRDGKPTKVPKPHVKVPTFLALGKHDYHVPTTEWINESKEVAKNIDCVIFNKSGHYPWLEEEELFIEKLKLFLNRKVK